MSNKDIVIIGSFVQDLTFRCTEFPRPGETIIGQFISGPGGKGSNQAVAAARAGGKVTFIGAVGDDAFGEGARVFQAAESINCRFCIKKEAPTGAAGILVDGHGQNEIIVALNANAILTAAELDAEVVAFRSADVVVTQLETNLEAAAHAMKLGRKEGAVTILNPAPMRADFSPQILDDVDILIPNETEFVSLVRLLPQTTSEATDDFSETSLAALDDEKLHRLCRLFGVPTVIVTLGSKGCFISLSSGSIRCSAIPGIKAVDTTGAGDSFVGAFAAGLVTFGVGEIEQAVRFANAAAALSVTKPGTAPAMPYLPEIQQLLQS